MLSLSLSHCVAVAQTCIDRSSRRIARETTPPTLTAPNRQQQPQSGYRPLNHCHRCSRAPLAASFHLSASFVHTHTHTFKDTHTHSHTHTRASTRSSRVAHRSAQNPLQLTQIPVTAQRLQPHLPKQTTPPHHNTTQHIQPARHQTLGSIADFQPSHPPCPPDTTK